MNPPTQGRAGGIVRRVLTKIHGVLQWPFTFQGHNNLVSPATTAGFGTLKVPSNVIMPTLFKPRVENKTPSTRKKILEKYSDKIVMKTLLHLHKLLKVVLFVLLSDGDCKETKRIYSFHLFKAVTSWNVNIFISYVENVRKYFPWSVRQSCRQGLHILGVLYRKIMIL